VKSLPGNRLKPRSVPANRLKAGVLDGVRPATPLTGVDINEITLAQVPSAAHADSADSSTAAVTATTAQNAVEAETALNAVNAVNAETVNGHKVGCLPGTQPFAGACWQASPKSPATAPTAAADCASQGGTLPEALELAAFANVPGVSLDAGNEWSSEIVSFTAENAYAVGTVSSAGAIGSALFNAGGVSATKRYRCVIPLVQ
jgi:hypothetical protein